MPSLTDPEFELIRAPHLIRWSAVVRVLWVVGFFAFAAYSFNDRVASAVLVVLAGLFEPVLRFVSQLWRGYQVPETDVQLLAKSWIPGRRG